MRSLSEQAMLTYLGSEEARRSTQLSLVANVANAYLTWRADQELLALAQQTLTANDHSWQLTSRSKVRARRRRWTWYRPARPSKVPVPAWPVMNARSSGPQQPCVAGWRPGG